MVVICIATSTPPELLLPRVSLVLHSQPGAPALGMIPKLLDRIRLRWRHQHRVAIHRTVVAQFPVEIEGRVIPRGEVVGGNPGGRVPGGFALEIGQIAAGEGVVGEDSGGDPGGLGEGADVVG